MTIHQRLLFAGSWMAGFALMAMVEYWTDRKKVIKDAERFCREMAA